MTFDYARSTETVSPFSSQNELIDCFCEILDAHIYYMYKYHSWVGPENTLQGMLGVVVTRKEFENNLTRATDSMALLSLSDSERKELEDIRSHFVKRVLKTIDANVYFPLFTLIGCFSLDSFELFCVTALLCCEVNRKYEKLFAYIQDDIARKTPTAETLIKLFAGPLDRISDYFMYFTGDAVIPQFIAVSDGSGLGSAPLVLRDRIRAFLTGSEDQSSDLEFWKAGSPLHPIYSDRELAALAQSSAKATLEDKTALLMFVGKTGSGRRFQVRHCAAAAGEDVLFADISEAFLGESFESRFSDIICAKLIRGCALCFTGFEYLLDEERADKLSEFVSLLKKNRQWLGKRLYVTSDVGWQKAALGDDIVKLDFEIPETDEAARLELWRAFTADAVLSEDVSAEEMAAKFHFTPGQIKAAAYRAADLAKMSGNDTISAELLHDCCYSQVVMGLNALATPIKPAYCWDDLVLPPQEIQILKEACAHVRYRHQVYGIWGFGRRAAYGRGLSLLFSGPPGTGKTMAAQVITNQLHMKMYKIQVSQVVSKYIGETEKNLRQVFTEARNANCILFFDEMDALFGKRSEVKDSHDRNANIETAYLLQQLEDHDGVVLMATNLMQNIDEAFMRRINFVVSFPFPDASTRKRLWEKMLDVNAPVDSGIDFDFLSENFKIAGGNIKNCVIHAAFLAAAENKPISMRHIISSLVTEQRKNNIVVLREDLKEYADLVFGE